MARRAFLRRLGRIGLVAPALPLLAACGSGSDDCDSDTGDPVQTDGSSDADTGDPCDSD